MLHPHDKGYYAFYEDVIIALNELYGFDSRTGTEIVERYEFWVADSFFNPEFDDYVLAEQTAVKLMGMHQAEEPEYDSAGFTEEDRIVDGQYRTYVDTVKQNVDKATEEGILKCDDSEGYSYMSKEGFVERLKSDQDFAAQWGVLTNMKKELLDRKVD